MVHTKLSKYNDDTPVVVNVASGSKVKLEAVRTAFGKMFPRTAFEVRPCPVELQDRDGAAVNAQPEGESETSSYAERRIKAMASEFGTAAINIAIESGAIQGNDVAVVLVKTDKGERVQLLSEPVAFPLMTDKTGALRNPLEEARQRGFNDTTAGDIINEIDPNIPGNSWQEYFPGPSGTPLSRSDQITATFTRNAPQLALALRPLVEPPRISPSPMGKET